MGVNSSKIQDLVDLGSIYPNGLYPTTVQEYDTRALSRLIKERKIAPFYKGIYCLLGSPYISNTVHIGLADAPDNVAIEECLNKKKDGSFDDRKKSYIEKMKQRHKMLYNDAVECPICFLVKYIL